MKLDATVMRTMDRTDFRLMEAVETGMRDHYIVPTALIAATAQLRHTHKIISSLLRDNLLSHERKGGLDGYRLTIAGYDVLALHRLKQKGVVAALGQKIGTGKESDIYLAATPQGRQIVLKFHRLGRTSFRNVRQKRDYLSKTPSNMAHSWLFLSRLSARKEYSFMKALYQVDYPTPEPIAQNRHIVAMSLVRGVPLYQIRHLSVPQAAEIYQQAVDMGTRLAKEHGLVHCDLNEFNLLVDLSGVQALATTSEDPYVRDSGISSVVSLSTATTVAKLSQPAWKQSLEAQDQVTIPEPLERLEETGEPKPVVVLIDFPQMISTRHYNAAELFARDMSSIRRFFELKLKCGQLPDMEVRWEDVMGEQLQQDRLDETLQASGVSTQENQQLELYYFTSGPTPIGSAIAEQEQFSEEEDESEEEDPAEDPAEDPLADNPTTEPVPVEVRQQRRTDDDDCHSMMSSLSIRTMTREELQVVAKERVRRQMDEQKRKSKRKGAFSKRNSNKAYEKGKRIVADSLMG